MSPLQAPPTHLRPAHTKGAVVQQQDGAWRLEIPAGPKGRYRLAQLDDYDGLPRRDFLWQPPMTLRLRARASSESIPGTWGFGLWNNPFGMAILRGAEMLRLPALPNTAWFFFASAPNYLSLRDDLPAQGGLAAAFSAPRWPGALLALGAPLLPFLFFPPTARLLRRLGRRIVRQDASALWHDVAGWHAYSLEWDVSKVRLRVDDQVFLETALAPKGPLGLVLWVDNQYAALTPEGRVGFGTLENPEPAWIEIQDLEVEGAAKSA
jgi:hypothetical protein